MADQIDTSPKAIAARIAHLRHVYGEKDPDAAMIEALAARIVELEAERLSADVVQAAHTIAEYRAGNSWATERARAEAAEAALEPEKLQGAIAFSAGYEAAMKATAEGARMMPLNPARTVDVAFVNAAKALRSQFHPCHAEEVEMVRAFDDAIAALQGGA